MSPQQRMALLNGTLREIIRIVDAARKDSTSIAIDDALDGRLAAQWSDIIKKARWLTTNPAP